MLSNVRFEPVSNPNLPANRYLLFVTTNSENDGNQTLFLVENGDRMYVEDFTPTKISVTKSGIFIKGADRRVYVGKTSTITFHTNDQGTPIRKSVTKKSKNGNPVTTSVDASGTETSLDIIKVQAKKISQKLYNMIKEKDSRDEIRLVVLSFMDSVVDTLHLTRLDEELMMECNL